MALVGHGENGHQVVFTFKQQQVSFKELAGRTAG
jgi:hypothetical protein